MTTTKPLLSVRDLSKNYTLPAGILRALQGVDLEVKKGEFVCLVGESGCGKSTLLRLIGGLEAPSGGELSLEGKPIQGPGLERGMVFQEARLFPWMTVEENIRFGCGGGLASTEQKKLVEKHLHLVGLRGFEKAYPSQLSGGMQQRAAMARALVGKPQILLLDEPFGALDALTRIQMQQEILRIWKAERTTMILVTHDIDEAVYLGDRVAVMTSRPGTFKRMVPVPLSRPRDRSGPAFLKIRKKIHSEFFGKGALISASRP
jgi:sulfonate transport system ATP-binding protein